MKKTFIISTMLIIILFCFSSITIAVSTEDPNKEESPSTIVPVGVEFVKDPFPIPRRNIVFDVYSNDQSLNSVNLKVEYRSNGKILYSGQGTIPVTVSRPYTQSIELPFYGFFQEGKIIVNIFKNDEKYNFDITYSAKTYGLFFYVCLV